MYQTITIKDQPFFPLSSSFTFRRRTRGVRFDIQFGWRYVAEITHDIPRREVFPKSRVNQLFLTRRNGEFV